MKLRKLIAVLATLLMLVGMLPLSLAVNAADIATFDFEDGAIPAGWELTTMANTASRSRVPPGQRF